MPAIHALEIRLEGNRLLSALPDADWSRLLPDLEWVQLTHGETLYEAGAPLRQVHFPVTANVSLVSSMRDGSSAEVAVVGREGVVGLSACLGAGIAHTSAVGQGAGHAWRMGVGAMNRHVGQSMPLLQGVLGYTQALLAHMAQTSACNRHHGLDQQLCRWLLLHLDRQSHNEMHATQERIARLLGVRREGVTGGAARLRDAGLIRYARGRISILDRQGLEARSCECYAVVRDAHMA
jgi:CRP-like cAMP-binding protein